MFGLKPLGLMAEVEESKNEFCEGFDEGYE